MRTIDDHQVRFGELAGPLVHGAMFFDWQLVSTQELAAAVEYSFQELVDGDAIPYAPVGLDTTVHRYPTFDDTVSVEVTPTHVGESSVQLVYEMVDGDGDPLSTAEMTHVTIAPEGGALSLPEATKARLEELQAERRVDVGPAAEDGDPGSHPTFERSFDVRSPHIEGSELAYFEEYPRFADVALESFLSEHATHLSDLAGDRQPFRLRDWHWEFKSPVLFDSRLSVECDVRAVTEDTVRIAHTFRTDGEVRIEGVSEYGCFDRSGAPTAFTAEMLAPFEA
ncbi:acyl-CoA thioesterase [Halobellus rufus]|uniref:acyl-CoA thioesterase n=1 Tax=Halobellus rufus TaxID=1448860 RepID=UPI000679735E|nr:acyl-[acyl-carrier-protein] thioesterase [Halobellus rufus]